MALTEFQRTVCRVIAANRIAGGESYVAGGAALNTLMAGPRVSRDLDLFHDTEEALAATWAADRRLLESSGYHISILREVTGFVEAKVNREGSSVVLQWARESAYRFFPLVQHEDFGLTLHPFDLATNKVLALVGRLEVRDWIDVIHSHDRIQPLGCLVWAACGKDPGFGPPSILEEASRSAHYSADEVGRLQFEGSPPDAAELSRRWRGMLSEAREIVAVLPADEAGKCVLNRDGTLFRGNLAQFHATLSGHALCFHAGCIRGALPRVTNERPG